MKTPKYVVLDTEGTGLHPTNNGLIEIGAAVLDTNLEIIDTINFDINPPESKIICEEALEINNFTIERIRKGLSYKDSCKKFHSYIKKHFPKDRPTYVAQFFPYDYAMMDSMYMESNMESEFEEIFTNKFIDTKAIVLAANMKAEIQGKEIPFPVPSLSKEGGLAEKFNLGEFPAHTALGDVMATVEVLKNLVSYIDIN